MWLLFSVQHPHKLPKCDVLKIDVEGAEALILENKIWIGNRYL
jgi:hypothetical protein